MDASVSRGPVTKRARAAVACNACRQTKAKCDSERPACGRCARLRNPCVYTQSSAQDKRLASRERRAQWASMLRPVRPAGTEAGALLRPKVPVASVAPVAAPSLGDSAVVSDASDGDSAQTTSVCSAVDLVAMGAFDNRPAADVGHFGPSSNFALFQSLTQAIDRLGCGMSLSGRLDTAAEAETAPPWSRQNTAASTGPPDTLASIQWVTRFLDGVGTVLPLVSETALLREVEAASSGSRRRSTEALVSIVYAHALWSSGDEAQAEAYYHLSLRLLLAKEQEIRPSRLETAQALLLVASYQQNSQRATASLISHALLVKTAYQLGLHYQSTYDGLETTERQLRARLWYGVVNQDIMLSSALGRPRLIPPQHVRPAIGAFLAPASAPEAVLPAFSTAAIKYFCALSTLHQIMGAAVDAVYDANLGSPLDLPPEDLVTRSLELLARLHRWRSTDTPVILADTAVLAVWGAAELHRERHVLLLSLHYHKAVMLASGPALMTVLHRAARQAPTASSASPDILQEACMAVLRIDVHALREFQRILGAIVTNSDAFMRHNAVWWLCNFTCFTMCLHLFALWILCRLLPPPTAALLGLAPSQAETLLLTGLELLRAIGAASVISFHAHRRLQEYVAFVRSVGENESKMSEAEGEGADTAGAPAPVQHLPSSPTTGQIYRATNSFAPTLGDLFCQLGDNDLFGMDVAESDAAELLWA